MGSILYKSDHSSEDYNEELRISRNIIKKFALENNVDFGIAGSLDISHTSLINQLQPNWVGYRGGVCLKKRSGPISRVRLENLIDSFC